MFVFYLMLTNGIKILLIIWYFDILIELSYLEDFEDIYLHP